MKLKNPHREAYLEQGGVLGNDKPKIKNHPCVSCKKLIGKKDMFIGNDAGRRWHLRCVMRSEAYHTEFGRWQK